MFSGLPIPCLFGDKNEVIINDHLIEKIKELIILDGDCDFWWTKKYDSQLFGESEAMVKSKDILDIWFDSGSSFKHLLSNKQADLYCEGVDQFGGWFQSSLLLSIALNDQSPYKNLLVHGFVVTENDEKMSKSLGKFSNAFHKIS